MKRPTPHRLSPSLVLATLALAGASTGTAIAAGGIGDKPTANPNTTSAAQARLARSASATGRPRRPDGSLLPHLGR